MTQDYSNVASVVSVPVTNVTEEIIATNLVLFLSL